MIASSIQGYREFVRAQSLLNPCLQSLVDYLSPNPAAPRDRQPSVHSISVSRNGSLTTNLDLEGLKDLISRKRRVGCEEPLGIILVIEDICPATVELLGAGLSIDPLFFCDHINTSFPKSGSDPLPPSLVSFPSVIRNRDFVNIHSQRILDLGPIAKDATASYDVSVFGNYKRNARRLVPLKGRQVALMRSCCSILLKKFPEHPWLCGYSHHME